MKEHIEMIKKMRKKEIIKKLEKIITLCKESTEKDALGMNLDYISMNMDNILLYLMEIVIRNEQDKEKV